MIIERIKQFLAGIYAKVLLRAAAREQRKAQEEDR